MKIIRGLHNFNNITSGCISTVGNYDGIHLGHLKVLNLIKKKSIETGLPSLVIIFEPHPREFFNKTNSYRLTTNREKLYILSKLKIDYVLIINFNEYFSKITPNEFITKIIIEIIKTKYFIVGNDFLFGANRKGNLDILSNKKCFKFKSVKTLKFFHKKISSSDIRKALLQGNLNYANKLLGYNYFINGKVIHGDHLGRNIGFPTANIYLNSRKLIMNGIYLVKVYGATTQLYLWGLANIGFRPTIFGNKQMLEVYICNFSADIYGKRITIEFYKKIRNEKKFKTIEELKFQIEQDILSIKEWIK